MGNQVIRGWRNAAARAGCSAATLRVLWEAGRLTTSQDEGGVNLFDADALDAVRVARSKKPITDTIANPDDVAVNEPSQSQTAPASAGPLPDFLARAVAASDNADGDEFGDHNSVEPDQATALPMFPPLGSTRASGFPFTAVAALDSQVRVAELEQQVAELQARLAVVCAERDQFRAAWREERVGRLSASEALAAAIAAGATPELVNAVGAFAAQALNPVPDDRLANEHVAVGVARSGGLRAASLIEQQVAWQREIERHASSDIERARDRRGMWRHRGRRW